MNRSKSAYYAPEPHINKFWMGITQKKTYNNDNIFYYVDSHNIMHISQYKNTGHVDPSGGFRGACAVGMGSSGPFSGR